MSLNGKSRIPDILKRHEADLLAEWIKEQAGPAGPRSGRISEGELREQCGTFLRQLQQATQGDNLTNVQTSEWEGVRDLLGEVSRSRATQGFSPSETATFVFSFKQPFFARLRRELGKDAEALADETWRASELLDQLGLYTAEVYQKNREDVILRQQQEMLELSTPVVKLWDSVLALPLIGTLDSARTQVVMEALLQKIVESEAEMAIIDITGVPTVDTLVAQHLMKTVTAARLMGAECIISGIRPQIAQTIVHLGVDLGNISTKATLADAFALALKRRGLTVTAPRHRSEKEVDVERIPILRMGEFLLVTIQVDMHDRLAMTLQDDLTRRISETGARAVLLDISSLEIVDSFIGRMIANISGMARVLDAETVVVGMQPAVAITLVELGLSLTGVRTALNVEKGMNLLRTSLGLGRGRTTMPVVKNETLPVLTANDVVLVRQVVRKWAAELGFSLVEQTKVVTATSELARNVLVHGGGGSTRLEALHEGTRRGLRLTFEDQGLGIPDIELALRDGYTTGGGLGLGLGGSKRLVNEFEIVSKVGEGTRVTITKWK